MPRNSSGTYTPPPGQPVVSGTSISSSTHNSLVSDLGSEITDSASRSGRGGFTAPIRGADGSAASPTHSWTGDTDSGLYSKGANNPAMSVGNSEKQEWTSAGSKVTGTFETTGAVTAGAQVNLSSVTSDPASPADGALWYRSDTDKVKARVNGATENVATENYVHNLTPLVVVSVASDGTIQQQKGRVTVTANRGAVGRYNVSAVGVTDNFMATATAKGALSAGIIKSLAFSDTLEVNTYSGAGAADAAFTLVVWAL